jgi:quercetin dioxygenase-like cupin family protein
VSEPQYHVAHLAEPGEVARAELERVFAAAWARVAHLRLEPGERLQRGLEESEAMAFVLVGEATLRLGELERPLREGSSVTLFQGEPLNLEAGGDRRLEIFIAEMSVEPQEGI